jgi:hypothetical protein
MRKNEGKLKTLKISAGCPKTPDLGGGCSGNERGPLLLRMLKMLNKVKATLKDSVVMS